MTDTVLVQVELPLPPSLASRIGYRVFCIAIALDVLVSALTGGDVYWTVSGRIGKRMADPGSRLSHWTWPAWWRRHCMSSVYKAWV